MDGICQCQGLGLYGRANEEKKYQYRICRGEKGQDLVSSYECKSSKEIVVANDSGLTMEFTLQMSGNIVVASKPIVQRAGKTVAQMHQGERN